MRILYCNKFNFPFSGTESYIFEAMELMRARGHQVALFSMLNPGGSTTPYDRHLAPYVDFKAAGRSIQKIHLSARAIYSRQARHKIRSMIADFRPDVAHVRNIYHHLSPSILWELRNQGVPVLYHLNDLKLLCPTYNMVGADGEACDACSRGSFYRVVSRGCYRGSFGASAVLALEAYVHRWVHTYQRCVDRFLAPSQFVRDKFVDAGWDASKFAVLSHFQKLSVQMSDYPGPNAPVLYFGRLSPEKGLRDVISAAARLRHVEFVIAGGGPQSSELQSLQQALRLNNLRFTGQLSGAALEQLIAQSQFTLFPSHAYETFGKSILESFAHGRAVIASDLGSRRALVTDGETGLLYRVGDVDQLVEAIEGLRCDPELARQMGLAGRERAQRDFCHETHSQALTTLYDELIAKRRSHSNTGRALKVAFIGGRGVAGKYSGIETCYEKVGERLAAKHVDITAYCRSYFTPNIANYRGIRVLRLPTIPSKHLDTFVHTLLSTVHACFHDFDIVHYHTLGPSLFSFLPRLFGKKTVVTVQGLDWQRKKWSLLPRTVLQIGEWTSVKFPNTTIVVSQALQQYYQSRYAKSVRYIPNATEVRNRNASGALQNLHLAPGGYVLFLGRLSPEKNCHVLIQAFEQVASPAMSLVLAGGSSHTDKYVSALRRHANERVVFLDWVSGSNKDALLTNAALFVLPSDMEGLSLALLDAMGAGICVLASDTPENCEAIADAGFTFRCGDVGDLTEMLGFLLDHPKVRADYGHKAQMRVQQQYLWDEVVNQHLLVYSDLAARSKSLRFPAPDAPTRRAA